MKPMLTSNDQASSARLRLLRQISQLAQEAIYGSLSETYCRCGPRSRIRSQWNDNTSCVRKIRNDSNHWVVGSIPTRCKLLSKTTETGCKALILLIERRKKNTNKKTSTGFPQNQLRAFLVEISLSFSSNFATASSCSSIRAKLMKRSCSP